MDRVRCLETEKDEGGKEMKLWEVIKALTEDPTKKFEAKLKSKDWTACIPDIASEETIESFKIAVAAMEKQDPMYAGVLKMNCDCPACGETMEYEHNYCPNCGQKLDWED